MKSLIIMLAVVPALTAVLAANEQSPSITRWKSLFVEKYWKQNQDSLEKEYLKEQSELHWSESQPLIWHIIEQDAHEAWYKFMQRQGENKNAPKIETVFGWSDLSDPKIEEEHQCVADLYYNSKKFDEKLVCLREYIKVLDNFLNCSSFNVRKTRMGQMLIWRMLKTVEHCYGQDEDDISFVRDLLTKIKNKDETDVDLFDKELVQTTDKKTVNDIKRSVSLCRDRRGESSRAIAKRIKDIDDELATKKYERKLSSKIKRFIGSPFKQTANSDS